MSDRVAATAALYALFLAGWAAALALRRRGPSPALALGAVLLQLTLVGQALGSLAAWAGDARPAEPAEHGGYLVASVAVLPASWAYGGGGRPRCAVVAVAAAALAVVCLRLSATWDGA